jgi:polyribonucleotide nucleotidyltransferase
MEIAKREIEGMTAEAEPGKIYRGKVVTLKEFGAFVEFLPGRDGLVHISELASFRVKQTEDIVKIGDEILVKCLGVDEKGRVRLSRKAAMEERDQDAAAKEKAEYEAKHGPDDGGPRGGGGGGERREFRGGDRDRGGRDSRGGDRGGRGGGRDNRGGGGGRDQGPPRGEYRGGERSPEREPRAGEPRPATEPRSTGGEQPEHSH